MSALLFILSGLALLAGATALFKKLFIFGVIAGVLSALETRNTVALLQWLGELPTWLLVIVGGFIALSLLGNCAAIFLGRRAADSMVGELAAGLVRSAFAGFMLPYRAVRRLIRDYFGEK